MADSTESPEVADSSVRFTYADEAVAPNLTMPFPEAFLFPSPMPMPALPMAPMVPMVPNATMAYPFPSPMPLPLPPMFGAPFAFPSETAAVALAATEEPPQRDQAAEMARLREEFPSLQEIRLQKARLTTPQRCPCLLLLTTLTALTASPPFPFLAPPTASQALAESSSLDEAIEALNESMLPGFGGDDDDNDYEDEEEDDGWGRSAVSLLQPSPSAAAHTHALPLGTHLGRASDCAVV